jgi:hypothetical protein
MNRKSVIIVFYVIIHFFTLSFSTNKKQFHFYKNRIIFEGLEFLTHKADTKLPV